MPKILKIIYDTSVSSELAWSSIKEHVFHETKPIIPLTKTEEIIPESLYKKGRTKQTLPIIVLQDAAIVWKDVFFF